MVYSVRNTGQMLKPVEQADGVFTHRSSARAGRCDSFRSFVLESHDLTADGEPINKAYLDRVIPAAYAAIQAREARDRTLLEQRRNGRADSAASDGRADNSVWGVATWTDVDPRIDFFSVYVGGLTNAYRWDRPGRGLPGRRSARHRPAVHPQDAAAQFLAAGRRASAGRAGNPLRRGPRKSRPLRRCRRGCLPLGLPLNLTGYGPAVFAVSLPQSAAIAACGLAVFDFEGTPHGT